METIHTIILGCLLGLTSGAGVLPDDSVNATLGGTVTFKTSLDLTETPFITLSWQFGTKNIITSNVNNFTDPEYESRITLFISTASLELRDVVLSDAGEYRVTIIPASGPQMVGTTSLKVYEPVSNVTVRVNSTDLVEFNSSVRLSCSSSGSSLSFLWFNQSSTVTANDRVYFTDGGSTLTIVSVTRFDQGPFRCHVSNPVSSNTSEEVKLNIKYGPYNVEVTGATTLQVGQSMVLFCTADSVPTASYSWRRNGAKMLSDSAVLVETGIDKSSSNKYICEATNSVTGKALSQEHNMNVHDVPLSGGAIAGIVIACAVIVGVVVGVSCHFYHKKK